MKTIIAIKTKTAERGIDIFVDNKPITPEKSQALRNHSPDGFNIGYGGSGPAQAALAILLEVTDAETACRNYQDFKWEFVARFQQDLTYEIDILDWILTKEALRSPKLLAKVTMRLVDSEDVILEKYALSIKLPVNLLETLSPTPGDHKEIAVEITEMLLSAIETQIDNDGNRFLEVHDIEITEDK